jgi:hypothetical protein
MIVMGGVPVVVMDEVMVVAVSHRLVPAPGAMHVSMILVNDMRLGGALVPMAVMLVVGMPVVQVVGVVAVGDGRVPAPGAVNVLVLGVGLVGRGHGWCSSASVV